MNNGTAVQPHWAAMVRCNRENPTILTFRNAVPRWAATARMHHGGELVANVGEGADDLPSRGRGRIPRNQDTLCSSRWSAICREQVEGLSAVVFGGVSVDPRGSRSESTGAL